ncbi:MAG: acetate/propionate family kinase [Christensenellales bacterium]
MKVLIVNAGSSSLKYQLIDMEDEKTLAKGLVERIGIDGSKLTQNVNDKKFVVEAKMSNHVEASRYMIRALTDKEVGALSDMGGINAVGHRVLHGGERFTKSVIIDDEVMDAIEANIPLGPLHNPANLMGIKACKQVMPDTPMVAVFDTAFHQTMPPEAYMYGVPFEYYERLKVRRYGFHGTSHRYVSAKAAEFLGKNREDLRIITCHLGNGSSICAVNRGKCVDTSMGLTPLEGLVMGTRSGSMDPAILQYIMNNENIDIDTLLNILNTSSGLLGISGISSDMRDVDKAAEEGNKRASLAREMLYRGVKKYIGAYAAIMGGVDVIVFTAGIGENGILLRQRIMEGMEYLGAKIDPVKNNTRQVEADVSSADSKVRILVIPTNEEIVIARDTKALVGA